MIPICLALHAHLPWRLRPYNYFDVGRRHGYFDTEGERRRLARADELCYSPAAALLERLLERHPRFSFSLSLSGPLLDQLAGLAPGRLAAFARLVETGRVEPLSATSHHCLSFPVSSGQVEAQLRLQRERVHASLGREPTVLGGEEPSDAGTLAALADANGFTGMLISGSDALPSGPARHRVYQTTSAAGVAALVPDDRLSGDIAVRFSDRRWEQWPLTAEKLDSWIAATPGEILCLSLDLASLGLANPRESGIFEFFEAWVEATLLRQDAEFLMASQALGRLPAREVLPAAAASTGQANEMQQDALTHLASLERKILPGSPPRLLEDFRRLTSSDHFEAMALRAGDARPAQPGAFESPYEAYMAFRHVVSDLERRVDRPRPEKTLSARTASA
jgi:alpha-amylase